MKKILFLLCLLSLAASHLPAQGTGYEPKPKAKEYFNQARKFYFVKDYKKAVLFCEKAKAEDPKYPDPYALLGGIYDQLDKFEEEIKEYLGLLGQDPDNVTGLVDLGTAYYNHGDYPEALVYYQKYLAHPEAKGKTKEIITQRVKNVRYSIEIIKHPVPFDPQNVGPAINTRLDEYFPTLTVDGETMYFTRRNEKNSDGKMNEMLSLNPDYYNEDIMVSHKINGEWQTARDAEGLNTPENEGAMCISPDGSFMIFTACNRPDGLGSCDLYISFYQNNRWTKPVNMGTPVNTRFYETQPSISYDGRTIYFASQRPGGYGGKDLYMSTRDDNWNFSEPVNLGAGINTGEDEQGVFIHPDDQTLYFCSTGHPGMGKNDIFYSRRDKNGKFDSAINVGYPVNTSEDQRSLIVDRLGEFAYYSSKGNKGYGGFDIFSFRLPDNAKPNPVTYLKGKVYDAETKAPLVATFELADLENGKSVIKNITSASGEFLVPVREGKDYLINVSAKGYLFYSDNIMLKEYHKTDPYLKDIPLLPIKTGQKITLKNIFYKTDAFALKDESSAELDRLISFLKANPALKIEISGHTDNTGSPAHNKELSLKRAQSVFNYLTGQGKIPASRLRFAGYGETQPLGPNATEEGKSQNRRTEVKIVE